MTQKHLETRQFREYLQPVQIRLRIERIPSGGIFLSELLSLKPVSGGQSTDCDVSHLYSMIIQKYRSGFPDLHHISGLQPSLVVTHGVKRGGNGGTCSQERDTIVGQSSRYQVTGNGDNVRFSETHRFINCFPVTIVKVGDYCDSKRFRHINGYSVICYYHLSHYWQSPYLRMKSDIPVSSHSIPTGEILEYRVMKSFSSITTFK